MISDAKQEGPLLLAGDVGGTKTDLAVVSTVGGPRQPLAKRRYPSADYPGLAEMSREFLDGAGLKVQAASFDVAGPVLHGAAQLTNLTWRLDEASLASALTHTKRNRTGTVARALTEPVAHLALLVRDMQATRGVGLERHDGIRIRTRDCVLSQPNPRHQSPIRATSVLATSLAARATPAIAGSFIGPQRSSNVAALMQFREYENTRSGTVTASLRARDPSGNRSRL